MDCSAEEQLIKLKLGNLPNIQELDFDTSNRELTVYHTGKNEDIIQRIHNLRFDVSLINSGEFNNLQITDGREKERKLLWQVLAINFVFFLVESSAGLIANSMGLAADSLDMLADSVIYGLALWAVGRAISTKKDIARIAGYLQLALAVWGIIEVGNRFFGSGPVPVFQTMIIVSALALVANGTCLYILQKSRNKEANIRASTICTSNDVIVNFGVIVAGVLVFLTGSKYPDLIIGVIVFIIVARGAFTMLKL